MKKTWKRILSLGLAVCLGTIAPSNIPVWNSSTASAAVPATFQLIRSVKVYPTAYDASARTNHTGLYPAGSYYIYKTSSAMVNISREQSTAGGWINPADNKPYTYTADGALGSRLNVDYMYNTIKTLSTRYPNRAFGTAAASSAASYIKNRISNYNYYNIEKQYSRAVNPLLGSTLVNVINVVARPKNFDARKKDVLFVAHYDTVLNTPGANDNASGVAMLIELSRYFSKNGADFNPVFLVCGGEEKGKPGTEDYLRRYHERLLNHTEIIINLDMVGMSSNYQVWNLNQTVQGTFYPQLAYDIGRDLGLRIELKRNSRGIADYKVFELSHIPTVTFMNITDRYGQNVPYYHTSRDSIDKISKTTLRNVSSMVMNMVRFINRKY